MSDKRYNYIPWLIFTAFLLFYIFVPNYNLIYDSYSYSISIRNGTDFFHPHHLLYNFFGFLIYKLFAFTGWGSMKMLSLVNAIAGAFTLLIIYKLIQMSAGRFNAILGTILVGITYSFRYLATSVEVNMMAFLFMMLAFYYLLYRDYKGYHHWLVYIFLAIGVLFHQVVVLAVPLVFIYDIYRFKSFKKPFIYALPGLAGGFLIYLIVGINQAQEKTIGGLYRWLTYYGHLGTWGKIGSDSITNAAWGKIKTLFGGEIIRQAFYSGYWSFATMLYLIVIALIYMGLVWMFIIALKNLLRSRDGSQLLILAMTIIFGLFSFWWAPSDDNFWIYPVVFVMVFIARGIYSYLARWLLINVVALLAVVNFIYEFIPSASKSNSLFYQGAEVFEKLHLNGNDLVITSYSQIRLAYEYYSRIHVPTICMMFLPAGPKAITIREYQQRIDEVLQKGRVYMFSDELHPELYRHYLFTRFSPEDYEQAYAPYENYLTIADSLDIHGQIVEIYRLRADTGNQSQ